MIDKSSFEEKYRVYHSNLKSFLYRLVANREDAEDLAQETFIRALNNLNSFEHRSSFKTWLFSIATNLAKDHHKTRKRWTRIAQDNCSLSIKSSPGLQQQVMNIYHNEALGQYEITTHIDYCFTCVMKYLSLERQLAIMLADIYEFKVAEIGEIMHLSKGVVKHLLHEGRKLMKEVFDEDCSLISKNGVCYKCSELSNSGNPRAETLKKINALELTKAARDPDKYDLYATRAKLVRSIDPLNSTSFHLHDYLLQRTDDANDKTYPKSDRPCSGT